MQQNDCSLRRKRLCNAVGPAAAIISAGSRKRSQSFRQIQTRRRSRPNRWARQILRIPFDRQLCWFRWRLKRMLVVELSKQHLG